MTVTLRRIAEAFDDDDFDSNQDLEAKKEQVEIIEILDKDGNSAPKETLKLNFNTLGKVENYWLETGVFT